MLLARYARRNHIVERAAPLVLFVGQLFGSRLGFKEGFLSRSECGYERRFCRLGTVVVTFGLCFEQRFEVVAKGHLVRRILHSKCPEVSQLPRTSTAICQSPLSLLTLLL